MPEEDVGMVLTAEVEEKPKLVITDLSEAVEKLAEDFPDGLPGIRSLLLCSYYVGRWYYAGNKNLHQKGQSSARCWALCFASYFSYGDENPHTGRKRRPEVDIDATVEKWRIAMVGLAVAHTKDDADRFEAMLDECLAPILMAPVRQLREFAVKFRDALKDDPQVPYLVWHGYELWIDRIILKASDEDVITLRTDLAREIAVMVEKPIAPQLSEALMGALQWRSPEDLKKVKEVVTAEMAAGRPPRLKGKESCLFLTAGGTEENPKVCIQI